MRPESKNPHNKIAFPDILSEMSEIEVPIRIYPIGRIANTTPNIKLLRWKSSSLIAKTGSKKQNWKYERNPAITARRYPFARNRSLIFISLDSPLRMPVDSLGDASES